MGQLYHSWAYDFISYQSPWHIYNHVNTKIMDPVWIPTNRKTDNAILAYIPNITLLAC